MNKDMNILVVDDFKTMRKIMKKLLTDLGYSDISEAEDGEDALKQLQEGEFEFMITDWNMPGMAGIDLLKAVRADPGLSDLPVMMVTAEAKREQIVQASEVGINGYVIKPFTAQTLKEKIDNIFANQVAA